MVRRSAVAALVLALGTVACGEAPTGPDGVPAVLAHTLDEPPAALARSLAVTFERPAGIEVVYHPVAGGDTLRLVETDAAARHELTLARLLPETDYEVEARGIGAGGRRGRPTSISFRTPPLPEDLAAIDFAAEGTPTEPLTMLALLDPDGFQGFVIVDARGRVVWYYRTEAGGTASVKRANGNFAMIDPGTGLLEITPAGESVAVLPHSQVMGSIHHEVIESEDRTLLFLALDHRTVDTTDVAGEAIWRWASPDMPPEKVWTAWDHLDPAIDWGPRSRSDDWLHANSLAVGPRGNVLVSLHYLNQVLSVSPESDALEWRFGGVRATIDAPVGDEFSGQHTVAEIEPLRLLMFDNGYERTESRDSRAVEFVVDPETGTSEKVWEWRPNERNWARVVSLARRLPNGNTFVAFGTSAGLLDATGPVEVYEINSAGEPVWHLEVGGTLVMYRAWPLDDIAGESSGS